MLSRLDDARVFLSSDDVVLGSSAARRGTGRGARSPSAAEQRGIGIDSESGSDDGAFEDEEHAQLHPQHPYNMRKSRAAAAKVLALHSSRTGQRRLADSAASQPMELVMLPSGDIRPRDECPPGLALPPPPAPQVGRRLEIGEISDDSTQGNGRVYGDDDDEEEEEEEEEGGEENNQEEHGRLRPKRTEDRRQRDEQAKKHGRGYRPAPERRPRAQQSTAQTRRSETPQRTSRASRRDDGRGGGYASSADDEESGFASVSSLSSSGHAGASTRNGTPANATRRRQAQHTATAQRDDSDEDEDELVLHSRRRSASFTRKERARQALIISRQRTPKTSSRPRLEPEHDGQDSRGSTALPKKMDVAPVYHIADEDDEDDDDEERVEQIEKRVERTHRQRTPRADRKIDVDQLVSSKEKDKTAKHADQSKLVKQLEQELQNEKKRVLEKMTLLLEEQGKNQQLHRQIETLESRLESSSRDATSNASNAVQGWEERVHDLEQKHAEEIKSMEEQLQQKDAVVLRLEQDKKRLKDTVTKLRERASQERAGKHSQTEIENDYKCQLDQLAASIRKFLKRVDRWKANSKEAMECCNRKTDLAALMESMWLDFPQFPDWTDTSKGDNNAAETPSAGHDENIVRFLKKRVRTREDELRQLQAKYVELKELCARQCVREADLQNFINEHRLRGNLIIRKGGNGDAEATKKRPSQRQHRDGKAPPSSHATKPDTYYEDDVDDGEYAENDRHGNNSEFESGDEDEEDGGEYPVREPKIFVQVGRDGVYEHTPRGTSAVLEKLADQQRRQGRKKASQVEVERIRLVPSPSLSQRYERVATPTSNGAALSRKKKTQTLLQPPPRSGSSHTRPSVSASQPGTSFSSLARRRQPTTSLRSKTAASSRPVAASARPTGGVGRPWV